MRAYSALRHRSDGIESRTWLKIWLAACVGLAIMAAPAQSLADDSDDLTDLFQSDSQQPSIWTQSDSDRLGRWMRTLVSADFVGKPLEEALVELRHSSGVHLHLDLRGLKGEAVDLETPVTCHFTDLTLREALRLVLGPLDLSWIVRDGVVWITSTDTAANTLVVRIYPVRDLANSVGQPPFGFRSSLANLIDVITTTLSPTTWDEVGGPGSVQQFAPSDSLVISQTVEVHEEIEGLLAGLRRSLVVQPPRQPQRSRAAISRMAGRVTAYDDEQSTASRYVITPTAAWSMPRMHQ